MEKGKMKMKRIVWSLILISAVVPAGAEPYAFLGPRAQGMGGAAAASTKDTYSMWHNPAAFGFMFNKTPETGATNAIVPLKESDAPSSTVSEPEGTDADNVAQSSTTNGAASSVSTSDLLDTMDANADTIASTEPLSSDVLEKKEEEKVVNPLDNNGIGRRVFGWDMIGFGAGYVMTEDMGDYLSILDDVDLDSFDSEGLGADSESVKSLLASGAALFGMAEDGNALYADFSAGTQFRIGRFGIGIRMMGEAAAYVDNLDIDNLGVEDSAPVFAQSINDSAAANGFIAAGYAYSGTLSAGQIASLEGKFGVDATKFIDQQLAELKNEKDLSQKDVDNAFTLVDNISFGVPEGTGDSLDNNESFVVGRAFSLVEIPFSYGYKINENLSVGITAKGMYGSVMGTKVWFFDDDSTDAAFDATSDNAEDTLNFGLDLGVLYRVKNFQFGLVGHNLNRPKFDGFSGVISVEDENGVVINQVRIDVPDVKIDPQVTFGAAFIPNERFSLETSIDILEAGTLLDGYDIQRISVGGELDVWLLALRLGAYKNIAADWAEWVATAGVGLNLYAFRIDVGGAYSLGDKANFDGKDIPTEARVYAGLSIDF